MANFFMEKEIFETGIVLEKIIAKYIKNSHISFDFELKQDILKLVFIASGSSYNGCKIAGEFLKQNINFDYEAYYSSEFNLLKPQICDNCLYIFASQSGETGDTLCALNYVKSFTELTLAVTNNNDSSIYKMAKYKINTLAGVEKSVASTKALCAQIFCLILLGYKLKNKFIDENLQDIPNTIRIFLNDYKEERNNIKSQIRKLSSVLKNVSSYVFLGSQNNLNLAKEASLKLSETSYINSVAFPFGEFLHGHFAILNKNVPILAITSQSFKDFEFECLDKIKQNYPNVLIINLANNNSVYDKAQYKLVHDICDNKICKIFIKLLIIQLFALNIAIGLGHDVDNPCGLSKIVK